MSTRNYAAATRTPQGARCRTPGQLDALQFAAKKNGTHAVRLCLITKKNRLSPALSTDSHVDGGRCAPPSTLGAFALPTRITHTRPRIASRARYERTDLT